MFAEFNSAQEYLDHRRPSRLPDFALIRTVAEILSAVQSGGDAAVKEFTAEFDGVSFETLRVSQEQMQGSLDGLSPDLRQILSQAIENVKRFHENQTPESWLSTDMDGSQFGMRWNPIERVGCYIPGGRAGYPSTVIMTVVPALIAGVPEITIVSPPDRTGQPNDTVLALAQLLGISEVYATGGAQAIAALAFGTQSIKCVQKIVGPGSAYVNEAKRQVFGVVGIDALAGPTEVVILADDSANPTYVVRDLFAQAEHGADSCSILITNSTELGAEVQRVAQEMLPTAGRKEIVQAAVTDHGAIIHVATVEQGVGVVNEIAPEHVEIMTANAESVGREVKNAGAICVGPYTPVATGDYFAGPNHVLPTAGTAKFSSPLSVYDFMKFSSVLNLSNERLLRDRENIAQFADLEGFPNHGYSVECRR